MQELEEKSPIHPAQHINLRVLYFPPFIFQNHSRRQACAADFFTLNGQEMLETGSNGWLLTEIVSNVNIYYTSMCIDCAVK